MRSNLMITALEPLAGFFLANFKRTVHCSCLSSLGPKIRLPKCCLNFFPIQQPQKVRLALLLHVMKDINSERQGTLQIAERKDWAYKLFRRDFGGISQPQSVRAAGIGQLVTLFNATVTHSDKSVIQNWTVLWVTRATNRTLTSTTLRSTVYLFIIYYTRISLHSVLWYWRLGNKQEGHPTCIKLSVVMLVVVSWLELCTSHPLHLHYLFSVSILTATYQVDLD